MQCRQVNRQQQGSLNPKLYMIGYDSAVNHCFGVTPSPGQGKRRTEMGENLEVKKKELED